MVATVHYSNDNNISITMIWAFEQAFCSNLFAREKGKKDFHFNPYSKTGNTANLANPEN